MKQALSDNFGRKINYLRLSVTDRCNMRCVYCMPAEGVSRKEHEDILSYEQFLLIAEAAISLGIEKIRVTGGEPLARKGLVGFLEQLAKLPGLRQLVLTTNGVYLAQQAEALKVAGVQRLNISLDSLRPEVFRELTRRDLLAEVLRGIDAAERVGLPYKINMVVMRGRNDEEILDFAELTRKRRCSVRFIEYMPTLQEPDWHDLLVPGDEILQRLAGHFDLTPVPRGPLSGPAREFSLPGGQGRIGVIAPFSGHFCHECNRIRITAGGRVKTCLFADQATDLKPILQTRNIELLAAELRRLINAKPARHKLNSCPEHSGFSMSEIGG